MLSIDLNAAAVQRRLIGYGAMCSVIAALFCLFLVPVYASDRLTACVIYTALALLCVSYASLLINAFVYARTSTISIDLDACSLKLPRLLFPARPRRIELAEISSIEELSVGGATNLVIGRRGRYPIFLEQALCAQPGATVSLKNWLVARLLDLGQEVDAIRICSEDKTHAQKGRREASIGVLLALLSLAFYLSTDGFSEATVSERLVDLGANTAAVWHGFELHRLFSSFFLHYNAAHLIGNLVLFAVIGQLIVRILGSVRFYNIVFLSSMIAVLVSSCFIGEDASFGASGGTFGLLGAYTVIKLRFSDRLTVLLNPIPNWVLALVLLVELVVGLQYEVIDVNNHLGGFFAGAAYALALRTAEDKPMDKTSGPDYLLLVVGVAAYAYAFLWLFGAPDS